MTTVSSKIKKLLTDPKNDVEIVFDEIKPSINGYYKMEVFNKNIKSPLQKIWFKIPQGKLLNNLHYGSSLANTLKIAYASNITEQKKMILCIKKIEKVIKKHIETEFPLAKIKSSVKKINDYMSIIYLNAPSKNGKFNFLCYDENNEKISSDDAISGCLASAYIELSDIWISSDKFGFNWNILQLKTYPVFDFTRCLFDDEEVENPKIIPPPPPLPITNAPPLPISIQVAQNAKPGQKDTGDLKFIPSAEALLDMRSKLKSVKENNKEDDSKYLNNDLDVNECIISAELEGYRVDEDSKEIENKFKEVINSIPTF